MKTKRNAFPGFALMAVLLLSTGCEQAEMQAEVERPVKTLVLEESSAGEGRAFPGTTRAIARAELSFRVSGPLVELPISEGQQVREGELLAQIDPRDFRTAVENLEAGLADLQAQRKAMDQARPEDIRRSEANVAAAQARLLEAEATFRRYQRLYENDNVSKADYDQRRAAREVAAAELREAEEELRIGKEGARAEDIEAMEARIRGVEAHLQRARDDLKDSSLRAPYDGVVAERFVDNFEFVQANQPVLSLQDMHKMELVAQIPEGVLALSKSRRKGSEPLDFYARFPFLPNEQLPAVLAEVAAQADPVTRTYAVKFEIPQPKEGIILAGMTGEILVQLSGEDLLGYSVPVSSVFADDTGAQCVWKLNRENMTVQKTKVQIGRLAGGDAVIMGGVNQGDTIITAGADYLEEGQTVRPVVDELRERK